MHIGIVGGGRMGKDVFEIFSRNGFQVTLYARRPEAAAALDEELLGALRRRASKGGARGEAAAAQLQKLKVTSHLEDLADCGLLSENIAEELHLKQEMFKALDRVCSSDCILSTNSSFITPDLLADVVSHPQRVIGFHFFYPTRLNTFVEVIPGPGTASQVIEKVEEVARQLKIRPVRCKNVPGFLVNRMIPSYYSEGILMLEEGYFTASEIDGVARSQVADLGPLETGDMIGLDILYKGQEEFPEIWRDGWIRPPILKSLVESGAYGVKTGRGFYNYVDSKPVDYTGTFPKLERWHSAEPYSREEVADRLYYTVVVEAFRHLDLGIGSEQDIDDTLKEVLAFKVKPIQSARQRGLDVVRERLVELTRKFGTRFKPTGTLEG